MKRILLVFTFAVLAYAVHAQNKNGLNLLVGTFTSEGAEGMYLCNFNDAGGTISLEKTFKAVDDPSFFKFSPDKNYLYVVTRATEVVEESGGFISAYKVGENGNLHFLNKQVSNGKDPCHVDVSGDGKFVAIAAYGGGTVSLYPVAGDGSLKPAKSVIENRGSGFDKSRQSSPHAHSVKFSPFSNQVFNADLGTDQLNIFILDGNKLRKNAQEFVKLAPGSGPRHFDFHPNGKVIYVINELNSTVTACRIENGIWKEFQSVSALPPGFDGTSYCADIHVSPDGRFLYGSNRGHNSVAVFSIDSENQKLKQIATVSTNGNWPRNFVLSPDGKYLLVANERSNNITVFQINKNTGIPEFTGNEVEVPAPVCLEFF